MGRWTHARAVPLYVFAAGQCTTRQAGAQGTGQPVVGPVASTKTTTTRGNLLVAEEAKALFSSEKFWKMDTVAFSFVFNKYCLIMD